MTQAKQKIKQWDQLIKKFGFDHQYGFLIPETYQPKSFSLEKISKIAENLPQLIKSGNFFDKVIELKELQDWESTEERDMVVLRQFLSYIVSVYIKCCKKRGDTKITLPSYLAKPLYYTSTKLGLKLGITSGFIYNWKRIKQVDMQNFKIEDIKLRWYFTQNYYDEQLFFGAAVIQSYFLCCISKLCYQINCYIELNPGEEQEIIKRLRQIKKYWQKIIEELIKTINYMNNQFFYYTLRPFVQGFQNVQFQGIGVFSSTGANAGNDPLFQAFEKNFGIKYQGQLQNMQKGLRQGGMAIKNLNYLKYITENSKIRQYCQINPKITNEYNQCIKIFAKFVKIHKEVIMKFIMKFNNKEQQQSVLGTSGTIIMKFINKDEIVFAQQIQNIKSV